MSHHFESGMFVKEPAWHGLGKTLAKDTPARFDIALAMQESGLAWGVAKLPIQVCTGDYVPADDGTLLSIPQSMQGRRVPDQFAVYRDSDNSVLGVVGSQYVPLQNAAAFDWFRPFLDARQCAIETCGSLMGGRIVWVLAKLDREDSVIVADSQRPDVVSKFLLLTTSHDGSKATRVGFVPIRVVCWNTLSAAIHAGASQLLKVKHTKSQGDALAAVRETVDTVNAQFEATADQYRKLVACRITKDDLAAYVKLVMQVDEGTADKPKVIGTRMSNIVDRIIDRAINGIGQDIAPASAWAAFNGVTEYLTYERGHSDDNRLRSLWYGDSANINSRALKLALAMAG